MSLFKNFLNSKTKQEVLGDQEPQVGFKLVYNSSSGDITVKILGAKQLPTSYGSTKPQGYLIKVTMFPQKQKFETNIIEQSWPTFDEEFKFKLLSHSKYGDNLKGNFLSLTAYALLYENQEARRNSQSIFSRVVNFTAGKKTRQNRSRRSFRHSLSNRRTIGSVTYNLEMKQFSINIGSDMTSTPEIWRDLKDISSGVSNNSRDNRKGSVEATMSYTMSETGNNDVIEVSVSKWRCNVQTMEQHERLGGKLYLKISAFEMDDVIQKIKSDKFDPTISLKLEKSSAKLKVKVDEHSSKHLRILIRLLCTPRLGQKVELGKIEIDSRSAIWSEMMMNPMVPITKVLNLG